MDLKKTDPYPNLVKYSLDVLEQKTKVFGVINMDKICFMKIIIESSPPMIWIRICFLEINGTPSLILTLFV